MVEIPSPELLVNVISRRVRQLGQGYRPLVAVDPRWSFLDVALKEVGDKKLTFEAVSSTDAAPKPRKAARKRRPTLPAL